MLIAHLADVQIRNFSRHDEYRKSFDNLYASLREKKPDRIVIVGDIAHTKTQISPEFVDICADFFRNLAEIAPLDLTLGNHDGNLKNPSRLDAITPIVRSLNNPRITLYKESGLYYVTDDVNYAVFSCFGSEDLWRPFDKIPEVEKGKINIALFHGTIDGVKLENDFTLASPYKIEMFKGYDYVLLGDIHRTMVLDEACRVAYPGSYPQQSYAELIEKGYFLWDIESKDKHTLEFIELPNVCPYYTFVTDSTLHIPKADIQKRARIRIITPQLTAADEKEIRDRVEEMYDPIEIKIVDEVNIVNREVRADSKVKVENLRNVSVQEALIRDFLKSENLLEPVLQEIMQINRKFNAFLENEEDVLRNVRYKIKTLKFDNLFSFGAANLVDYEKMKGINGVFGRNAVGKSSLAVDALLYCLFNKISKEGAVKNNLYINDQQEKGGAELEIEMGTDTYFIQRTTEKYVSGKRSGNTEERSATSLTFTKKDSAGSITDFTGEERAETDKEIKKVFGTPEDFMITAVAPQFDLINFLKNRATDRKKTIGRYFDLDIFEKKFALANEELKSLKRTVKLYESKNFEVLIAEAESKIININEQLKQNNIALEQVQKEKEEFDRKVWELEKNKLATLTAARARVQNKLNESNSLKRTVESLEKDVLSFDKFLCVKNSDCCMKQKKTEVEVKLDAMRKKLQEVSSSMNVFVKEENELANKEMAEDERLLQENRNGRRALVARIGELSTSLQQLNSSLGAQNAGILSLRKEQEEYERVKKEFDAYHYYAKAMGKDGISYNIIAGNLHVINSEIKKILAGTVNFEITLEDEEKEVNIYFKHGNNKKRIIELCSGMEKTVAAIAIRAALMSVTTLPVPNIIVFDEIFDSLEADNLEAVTKILQNLKRLFEVILIITHSDTVKDICDNVIFIERDANGYARINS